MLSFREFISEAKKINMSPEELETAYKLRAKGTKTRDFNDIMGYSDKVHNYLDHPDTRKRAESLGIEYSPNINKRGKQKLQLSDRHIRRAFELRGSGVSDKEMLRDPDYGFSQHVSHPATFTKHLESHKDHPDYVPSRRKKEKRSADFEPTIYKKSLSGMSHREIAGEHGISPGNVRAIVSRQHKLSQGKEMKKDISESWVETRKKVLDRVREKRDTQSKALAGSRDEHLGKIKSTLVSAMNALHGMSNNKDLHPDARDQASKSLGALKKHFNDHF
jgi:hypothetical protein